ERNEPLGVRDRRRDDDLRRHGRRGRVVLAEEGPEHVGGRGALGALEREVVPAHDRAVAYAEHLDDGVPFRDRRGEDVEVVAFVRVHFLAVPGPLDRGEPVAQSRSALERACVRGLAQLCASVSAGRSPSVRVRRIRGKSSPSVTFTYGYDLSSLRRML